MKMKKLVSLLLCAVMVLGMIPATPLTAEAAYNAEGTTYVRVNSPDQIVPNARYIVLGEYEAEGVETRYFAMSKDVNTYDDIRVGLTPTTYTDESKPHFVLAEDKQSLTLHSDSILKVRLRATTFGSHQDLYKMQVDDQGYLYGFCNSYYYYGTSCCRELSILNYTKGNAWWHFRMGGNGYWQIATYLRSSSSDMVTLTFNDAYGDFMSYLGADSVRIDAETYFFENYITEDRDSNILLFREVCDHKEEEVTYTAAKAASCTASGNPEHWYCAGCEQYSATADFSQLITVADTLLNPLPHTDSCGHTGENGRFELCTDAGTSSSQDGKRYVLLGKAGDKLYAMGNVTNADGSRNAVEVSVNANGVVTANSGQAEFLTYYCPGGGNGFLADDCYFSAIEGKLVAYSKELYDSNQYIPDPARFQYEDYETGEGSFGVYIYTGGEDQFVVFDEEALCFRAQSTRIANTYLYQELCPHTNAIHYPETKPTCTQQGVSEYWYCGDCYRYYDDSAMELPLEVYYTDEFNLLAFGHTYQDGVCVTCGMPRTYHKISTLEAFDALNAHTTYMIVVEDGDKTYAAALPPKNPCDVDDNKDGISDIAQVDENANGIPDCVEAQIQEWGGADQNEDGAISVEEYNAYIGDLTEDGVVNSDDYLLFFEMDVYWQLYWKYDEQLMNSPNFVEVTTNQDGTITITDEAPMEFQMMEAGVWGGQLPYEGEKEEHGITDAERIRAAWIPNYWIGVSGQMGYYSKDHFMTFQRNFGDNEMPGIIDHKNWKISFNEDGTACLVDTWEFYDDTGALQLVHYTNEEGNPDMTFVGMPEWLWTDSFIMQNRTGTLPVYLYAAEPQNIHICQFGEWVDDENERTHTRTCTDPECGATETQSHNWTESERIEPTCTQEGHIGYQCVDCGAGRTEKQEALGHDWSEWSYDGETTHSRFCRNGCGIEQESGEHQWSAWTEVDEDTHKMVCQLCKGEKTGTHNWDEGVVVNWATHLAPGEIHYTCADCGLVKSGELPALTEHEWSDWTPDTEGNTHTRACLCGETQTLAHQWGEWLPTDSGDHIRICPDCNAEEQLVLPENQPVNSTPVDALFSTNLTNTDIELIEKVLTDEEQSQMAQGATVQIYLQVEDISQAVPTEDKSAALAAAGESQIGMYLDIDLFKKVNEEESQVTQTDSKVTITLQIPEELRNTDTTVDRVYRVIRVHTQPDGTLVTDVIEGIFDPENNTFTFETDKFSTYALTYTDEDPAIPGDLNADGLVTTDDVVALLLYLSMPDIFPLGSGVVADFNKDAVVSTDDAVLLLLHISMPDVFPL